MFVRFVRPVRALLVALPVALPVALAGLGCSSPPALRIKANDPSTFAEARPGQPMIVQFEEGDVIPLSLVVQGELVETNPTPPPIRLVAKRRFFLKIDGDGVRTSIDGEHWGASKKRGTFAFGLGFDTGGTKATARIVTPSFGP